MLKKWWNKTRTMVCGALFIGALTATSALAVVACGSNDFNLIYTLDINQKTLYFADYTKLTYYLQELLKLEVTVI